MVQRLDRSPAPEPPQQQVALSNIYPETKDTVKYVKAGWHVTVAYIVSFFVMLGVLGWNPHPPHKKSHQEIPVMQHDPGEILPIGEKQE